MLLFFSHGYFKLNNRLLLFITVFGLLFASCSEDSSVIDSALPDVPLSFANLQLSAYTFDTDSISIQPGRTKKPDDPVTLVVRVSVTAVRGEQQGSRSATEVRCRVVTDAGSAEKATAVLPGANHAFADNVSIPIRRGDVGDYRVIIEGTDDRGNAMNPIFTKINVIYGNNPPTFCGLIAPDTVTRPASGFVVMHLEVCVTDVSGPGDIESVYFNTYREPEDSVTAANVSMYDNGTNGDRIAGDGQYSRDIQLPAEGMRDIFYRFQFYAIDRSNLQSNILRHRIYVR